MKSIASLVPVLALATAQQVPITPLDAVPQGVPTVRLGGFQDATVQPSRGGLATCVSGIVSVEASAVNAKFDFTIPANQSSATDTFLQLITPGSPFAEQITNGVQDVSGTYSIGATLCTPADDTTTTRVQLLTHGLAFDRYYWDFAQGYSYVDAAIQNGYATLSYDRLGVGASTRADPVNELQASLEVEIAASLARQLRAGTLGNTTFTTVVGTGHSFGSIITQAVTTRYPTLLDAAILSGFTISPTAVPPFLLGLNLQIARENNPDRFSALPLGYLVSQSAVSSQQGFFRAPNFDPAILYAAEADKETVSYGEIFTIGAVTAPATDFTGPVAIVNGNNDLPFCFGNCSYPADLSSAVLPALYPNLKSDLTGTWVGQNMGHGVNLHYTAGDSYAFVQGFLNEKLGA